MIANSLTILRHPPELVEFIEALRTAGIGVVASDAFAISDPPEAVRLGLGSARTRDELRHSLEVIAGLLAQSPAARNLIV